MPLKDFLLPMHKLEICTERKFTLSVLTLYDDLRV